MSEENYNSISEGQILKDTIQEIREVIEKLHDLSNKAERRLEKAFEDGEDVEFARGCKKICVNGHSAVE